MLKPNSFIDRFFPHKGIPANSHLSNKRMQYFNTDIESRQIDTGYNDEIEYLFNKHGYRSVEFDEIGEINVLAIGCSVTFGIGIPAYKRFSRIFCDMLAKGGKKVVDWNLAMPGESIDYMTRIITLTLPILKPHILLVNFPSLARREFFSNYGNRFDYRPKRDAKDLIEKDIIDKINGLSSYYDDLARFFVNFKLITSIAELYGCKLLYAVQKCDLDQYHLIAPHCQDNLRVLSLEKQDRARDGGHPGVETNFKHGLNYYEKYIEVYS